MSELEAEYVDVLKGIKESAIEGKEFILEQAPLVAQEIIWYARISESLTLGFILVLFAILAAISWYSFSTAAKSMDTDEQEAAIGFMFCSCGLAAFFLIVVIPLSSCRVVKAWAAPRLVVIEKVSEMVGK